MITQTYKNGDSEIKIEIAESLEDAKNNKFIDGIFSRFFINNKPVSNYMTMIRYIVDETRKTGNRFIPPTAIELKKIQKEVIEKQNEIMKNQIQNLKNHYSQMNVPENILKELNDSIDKLDISGLRVVE